MEMYLPRDTLFCFIKKMYTAKHPKPTFIIVK